MRLAGPSGRSGFRIFQAKLSHWHNFYSRRRQKAGFQIVKEYVAEEYVPGNDEMIEQITSFYKNFINTGSKLV